MFVWRKRASPRWLAVSELKLRETARTQLAVIQEPNRKTALAEVAGRRRRDLEKLQARFGGRIERLPRGWLKRALDRTSKPIKIGKRLIIVRSRSAARAVRLPAALIMPAGTAFGTGEHATTAMSLRLLEQTTREVPNGWSMLDLGTGTGILALAGRRLGAKKVMAIDSDRVAISVAKENARLNGIAGIDFRVADARKFPGRADFRMVTANLYSELLIEILPKLKGSQWLILSGILREQEPDVVRALRRNKFDIVVRRRRAKWVALFAGHPERSRRIPRRQL